jgi:hypothetical protein
MELENFGPWLLWMVIVQFSNNRMEILVSNAVGIAFLDGFLFPFYRRLDHYLSWMDTHF